MLIWLPGNLLRVMCLLGLLVFAGAKVWAASGGADIIEITTYHADELNQPSNQVWQGLFQTGPGAFELRSSRVWITRAHDDIADEKPEQNTGKRITCDSPKNDPLILIRGVTGLKLGKVVTSPVNAKEHLDIGQTVSLKAGDTEAKLVASGKKVSDKKGEDDLRGDYIITLESGGIKQQIIRHAQISSYSAPSLLWAGDIDGDGKLDLLMDTTDHYNVRDLGLFLSSKAKPGKLVERVASHVSTGC